jgi:calcineurin-like phosphoesterase family protein
MQNVFLISDTHFGHSRIYEMPFVRSDGTRLRPWLTAEEADEAMVERWNAVVRRSDKVYHLGDVAMPRSGLKMLDRLNGDKILIAGNHDAKYDKDLHKHFRSVRSHWKLENFALSHVPIHPDSLQCFRANIHGHLHYRDILIGDKIDERYINVSVEKTDYTPIELSEIIKRFK